MRRPSFQFYHGDWRSNAKLRRCNHTQRGIWLEVMCLMADEDEFGLLRWPLVDVSNAVPCRVAELRTLVERDVMKGAEIGQTCKPLIYTPRHAGRDGSPIILIPEQPGPIWYSSRMVRDAYIATTRGKGTRFGDEPKAIPKAAPIHREGYGPSSSTASSTSQKAKATTAGKPAEPDGFAEFRSIYPKRAGNNPLGRALKAYRSRLAEGHATSEFIEGARRYADFIRAVGKEGTEFVLQASTFLGPDKPFAQEWAKPNGAGEMDVERIVRELKEEELKRATH